MELLLIHMYIYSVRLGLIAGYFDQISVGVMVFSDFQQLEFEASS